MVEPDAGVIGVGIFRAITRVLQERGIDPAAVYQRAAVPIDAVVASDEPLPIVDAYRLLEVAASYTNEPNFGLKLAPEIPVGATGLLGHLQATAPTVRHMIEATAQYGALMIQPVHCTFEDTETGGQFSAVMPGNADPNMRQLTDLLMATLLDRLRVGTGPLWYPRMVGFVTAKPRDTSIYEDHFGSEIWFEQPVFSISIETEMLDRELPNQVLGLFDQIKPLAQKELAAIEDSVGVARLVRLEIEAGLDAERPITLDAIASRINLAARGLQWRLFREHQQTFEGIFSNVRETRVTTLLSDPDLSMTEIAPRLGFATPSAFSRWCREALGKSPSDLRRELIRRPDADPS